MEENFQNFIRWIIRYNLYCAMRKCPRTKTLMVEGGLFQRTKHKCTGLPEELRQ